MKVNPVLIELYLGRNQIGPEGATVIAEALKVNPVLTVLNLSDNSIGDNGAKSIAEALKVNPVLTDLSLGNNKIGVDGAKAIAVARRSTRSWPSSTCSATPSATTVLVPVVTCCRVNVHTSVVVAFLAYFSRAGAKASCLVSTFGAISNNIGKFIGAAGENHTALSSAIAP